MKRPRRDGSGRRSAPTTTYSIDRIEAALAARKPLLSHARTDACRLFHGAADGIDGLVIEKLGEAAVVQLHEGKLAMPEARMRELCELVRARTGVRAIYRKTFARDRSGALRQLEDQHLDPMPFCGEPVEPEIPVTEFGIRYLIRPYDGYSVGLFLEQRENRARVRRIAGGCRVLNAFAYTCAFSVSAALGGAVETVSVDLSKRFLEWGKRNFAANDISLDNQVFICTDIFDFYKRAGRQGRLFDMILLDPPSFSRSRRPKRVFAVEMDLERLVAGAVALLDSKGYLLMSVNHRGVSLRRLERAAVRAAGRRDCVVVERPELPSDFPGDPDYAKSVVVRVS